MNRRLFPRIKAFAVLPLLSSLFVSGLPSHQNPSPSRGMSLTGPVKDLPAKAKRWALVIGVDQYRDGNISPLRGAANDANKLSKALVDYAGFPKDQVILLATDQPEERQPTRVNI